jgi:hypothetical protein
VLKSPLSAYRLVILDRTVNHSYSDSSISIDHGPQSVGTDTQRALGPVASALVQPENKMFGSVLVLQASASSGLLDSYR